MLRFIIKNSVKDHHGIARESLQTLDIDIPDLEIALLVNDQSLEHYNFNTLVGVEVLPESEQDRHPWEYGPHTSDDPDYWDNLPF